MSPSVRRALTVGAVAAIGATAGLLAVGAMPAVEGRVGPGRVSVQAAAGAGVTEVALPPLGQIVVRTPQTPVRFTARVEAVDVEALQRTLTRAQPEQDLLRQVEDDLPGLLRRLAIRAALAASVAGAVAPLLLPRRRWWFAPAGAATALVAVAALGGMSWRTFDPDAFAEPRFSGALERAPAVVEAAQRHVDSLQGVADRVQTLGRQLSDLYAASALVDVGGHVPGETRLLHVSDLHSNPLGVELVTRLATAFDVDAVLDTGDLTSFGYPVEATVVERLGQIPVPYLYVPGNHDSLANRLAIAELPNVRLLDGEAATVGSLRVLGVGDPTFTASNELSTEEATDTKRRRAPAVAALTRRVRPDVLAVHDPVLASEVEGVPLVVAGHVHERRQSRRGRVEILSVGSAGATGLGSFTVQTDAQYEAQVLRFRGRRLVAVDYITVRGVTGDFAIDRRLLDPDGDAE